MKAKLRALGERWRWLGRALDVQERVGEINGSFASAAITLNVFTSMFPLALVAIAVVGFLANGDATLPDRMVDSLGLTGSAADTLRTTIERAARSRAAASTVGLIGLAWSGSGVATALQQGVRAPWQAQSSGIRDRLLGIVWPVVAALGLAVGIALGGVLNFLPDEVPKALVTVAAIAVGLALEIGVFWFVFWGLGTRRVPARDLLPGAILGGISFEILKLVGTVYVPRVVASASSLYGPLGVVFALLAWLTLLAKLIIYASTLNAVRYEAREGTRSVPILVPALPAFHAVAATRGGVMIDEAEYQAGDAATPD